MLIGSAFRPRVLLYAVVVAIVLLAAKTLYTTPPGQPWVRPLDHKWLHPSTHPWLSTKLGNGEKLHGNGASSSSGAAHAALADAAHAEDTHQSTQPEPTVGEEDHHQTEEPASQPEEEEHDHEEPAAPPSSDREPSTQKPVGLDREADAQLPCRNLPGAEDVTVIMRTGATEIQDKIPAHFETTFRCYSDLLIFSDYEEIFMGEQVHDVLKNVDRHIKVEIEDFDIYLRLEAGGRVALRPDELSGKLSFEGSKSGKPDNPGWRLDKWKFLPMMRETLNLRPDKKWFIFVESDSYIVWSNMLKYLERLDPEKPIYYGSEVQIGDDLFAHGGSAFIMSRPAIEKAAEKYEEKVQDWHDLINDHWAGDCVLGIVLLEAGVELGWGWPMFQGGHPEKMDFAEDKGEVKIWCSPINSFHHFNDIELHRIWQFEQDWISVIQDLSDPATLDRRWSWWADHSRDDTVLHGQDVFKAFVYPNLTDYRLEWNSLSPDKVEDSEGKSVDECRRFCEDDDRCVQYTHAPDGCFTSPYAMLGQPWGNVSSGWLMDRVDNWMHELDKCDDFNQDWLLLG